MTRRRRNSLLLLSLGLAVCLAVYWAFRPYRVVGESMEPSLVVGDWLRIRRELPERDELVIFHEPDSGKLGVKRVVGMPGDRVQLLGGDVLLDGKVYQRPLHSVTDLVPLLDEVGKGAADRMHFEGDAMEVTADGWSLNGRGRAFLSTPPMGGYLLRGEPRTAVEPASDLGMEVEYQLNSSSSSLELILRKGQTTFTASLVGGGHQLMVQRQDGAGVEQELLLRRELPRGEEDPDLAAHRHGTAFFTIANQGLTVVLNGEVFLDHLPFEPVKPLSLTEVPADFPQVEHAGIGGRGMVEIGRIRLGRDVLRQSGGTFATGMGLQLADGQYFLLGDHPAASRDSRHYGAVSDDLIVGTVAARWWPKGWTLRGWAE